MDILNDCWSPALTVEKLLYSIQSLLSAPESDDPINFMAALQLKMSKTIFEAKVKEYILMKGTNDEAENILNINFCTSKNAAQEE